MMPMDFKTNVMIQLKNKMTSHRHWHWVFTITLFLMLSNYAQCQPILLTEIPKQQTSDFKTTWHKWQLSKLKKLVNYHLTLSRKHHSVLFKIEQHLEDIYEPLELADDKNIMTTIKLFVVELTLKLVQHRIHNLDLEMKKKQQQDIQYGTKRK